jgi:hypothetical protein
VRLVKWGPERSNNKTLITILYSMGWSEWSPAMIQPGKQHTDSRRLFQKGVSPQAVLTYKDLVDTTNKELLKWALDYSDDPEPIVSKYVAFHCICPSGVLFSRALLYTWSKPTSRAIGRILVGVAYGDALTREEEAKLLAANKEALAITGRAFTNVYLVDFIPVRKSSDPYSVLNI